MEYLDCSWLVREVLECPWGDAKDVALVMLFEAARLAIENEGDPVVESRRLRAPRSLGLGIAETLRVLRVVARHHGVVNRRVACLVLLANPALEVHRRRR